MRRVLGRRRRSGSRRARPVRRGTPPRSRRRRRRRRDRRSAGSARRRRSRLARRRSARQSPVPRAKNIGHTSLLTRASTIGNSSAHPQLRRSPQTETTAARRAAGRGASRSIAAGGDGTYISPSEHSATSNGPVASSCSASQRRTSTLARPPAAPALGGVVDHLLRQVGRQHVPVGPTAAAAGSVTIPVPHAMSMTCWPGRRSAARQEPLVRRPQLLLPERLVVPTARSHPCRCTQRGPWRPRQATRSLDRDGALHPVRPRRARRARG